MRVLRQPFYPYTGNSLNKQGLSLNLCSTGVTIEGLRPRRFAAPPLSASLPHLSFRLVRSTVETMYNGSFYNKAPCT